MRRILLVTLLVIVGSLGLFALYVWVDIDPDDMSPMVDAVSYRQMFDTTVARRTGSSWKDLDADARMRLVSDLVMNGRPAPVREVALFEARNLTQRDSALDVLSNALNSLDPEQYEVAIASIKAIGTPRADAMLDSIYGALDRDPASHTPVGGYRTSTATLRLDSSSVAFAFDERSRDDADYTMSKAREISLFFPNDPAWVAAAPNVDDELDAFEDSRFSTALDGSPVPEDAWRLPLLRVIHGIRSRLSESVGFLADRFSPETLVRDNFLIARYGTDYLIVSYRDKNLGVAESMVGAYEALGGDFGIRRWNVDGEAVAEVVSAASGQSIAYATPGDYLVAATDSALIGRAIETFTKARENSIGIDPVFRSQYARVGADDAHDLLFVWFNPTEYFDVTGSQSPAARRLAIVARALNRRVTAPIVNTDLREAALWNVPGIEAVSTVGGEDPVELWNYIANVRSLGNHAEGDLQSIAGVDVSRQIAPFLAPAMTVAYGGVDYLSQPYGFSHTGFNLVAAVPLRDAPVGFDTTVRTFLANITSLDYQRDSTAGGGSADTVESWIARDTTSNDSTVTANRVQPSFALIGTRLLVIASTPRILHDAVAALAASRGSGPDVDNRYISGSIRIDSLSANATRYLKQLLMRSDRFSPEDVADRLDPLRSAIAFYPSASWTFREVNGLRQGSGSLTLRPNE